MRCEATEIDRGWRRVAVLAAFWALVALYGVVLFAILSPRWDEAYRRNFVTGEFGAYPTSPVFGGRNALAVDLDRPVSFGSPTGRFILNRFDWVGKEGVPHGLDRLSGRIFIHLPPETGAAERALTLRLSVRCAFPAAVAGRFRVMVNGAAVGGFVCADRPGDSVVAIPLPAGALGVNSYDGITVEREAEGWRDRVATELGMRRQAFKLVGLEIATAAAAQ